MEYVIINSDELYHHGVLGMHWGVRRYQNLDGSYKNGAEGRYDPEYTGSKRRGEAKAKTSRGSSAPKKEMTEWEKSWTAHYMDQGKSLEDAEKAAKTRKKVLQMLAVGAGVAAAGAIGYSVYSRLAPRYCDKILKAGTKLQNVYGIKEGESLRDFSKNSTFYSSFKKGDKSMYRGLMYNHIKDQYGSDKVVNAVNTLGKNIKIASDKTASKELSSLFPKGSKERNALISEISKLGIDDVKDTDDGLWKVFNKYAPLVRKETGYFDNDNDVKNLQNAWSKFTDHMERKGYNGIYDINDRNDGFQSKSPLITFGKNYIESTKNDVYNVENMGNNLSRIADITRGQLKGVKAMTNRPNVNKMIDSVDNMRKNGINKTDLKNFGSGAGKYLSNNSRKIGLGAAGAAVLAGSSNDYSKKNYKIVKQENEKRKKENAKR